MKNFDVEDKLDRFSKKDIKKYIFILNPTAGKHRASEIKAKIVTKFEVSNKNDSLIVAYTERPLHAKELARDFALLYGDESIIYACGGDGTINEVANGIYGTKSSLGVIPMGTGNDFVKSVYSARTPEKIIENLFNYKFETIDCASIDKRIFMNVTSLGFDTIVANKAKELVTKFKVLGKLSYFLAIFICLAGKNYSKMKYKMTGESEDGINSLHEGEIEFVLAAFANGKSYGGMFTPCPDALVKDGILDVCIAKRLSVVKILPLIPRYMKGTHINHPAVEMFKIRKAHIEGIGESLCINCDGESFIKESVDIEIIPDSIRLAVY